MAVNPQDALSQGLSTDFTLKPLRTTQDVYSEKARLAQPLAAAQAETKRAEMGMEQGIVSEKAKASADIASEAHKASEAAQQRLKEFPYPEFHPTQDNVQSLAGLFSIVSTLGMMLGAHGKMASMNALKSMTGMMNGWRQGRADLFKNEAENFQKEFTRIKAIRDDIKTDFDEYMKLLPLDRESAMLKAEEIARKAGTNSIIASYLKTGNLKGIEAVLEGADKALAKKEDDERRRKNRMEELAYQRETTLRAAQERAAGSAAKQSVLLSGRAENIREAFVQAAADVENVSKFPSKTVLGTFAGMTGQEGNTLTSSLSNTFARHITSTESRMLQQLVSGLETNLANALGGGYASSASKARMDQYKSQIPKEGDNGDVAANFLARIRQEMNLLAGNFSTKPGATPEMNQAVQEANERINAAIPFTVDDVLNAFYSKDKPPVSPNVIQKSQVPELTEEQYNAAPKGTRYRMPGSTDILVKQ